ncbi:hypothetical protein [Priestia megaterium]|uniref:hypothetical protein n=1 Tax=Priestia megaterium TaxID=1404 RepID=UPI001155DA24|nr:hypothetical protein [Priestia megaterium]
MYKKLHTPEKGPLAEPSCIKGSFLCYFPERDIMLTKDIYDIHRFFDPFSDKIVINSNQIRKGLINVTVNVIFNPFFALIILVIGVWMGSTVNQLFGLVAILGGLLLGFSNLFKNGITINKKSKVLLFASFVFLLSLFSLTYLVVSTLYL